MMRLWSLGGIDCRLGRLCLCIVYRRRLLGYLGCRMVQFGAKCVCMGVGGKRREDESMCVGVGVGGK
jgi:hypothetical protein